MHLATPVDMEQHYSRKESKQVRIPDTDTKHFLASSGKDGYAMELAKFYCVSS